ncbi:MAG TPA: glycosyltransferase family 4 protein, partial [Candidatus Binatia bacterium]|nr:glycosyltransferase family 4 protein [Candidatus Binatia bacterium]
MEQLLGSLCDELSKNHKLFIITAYANHSCPPKTGIFRPSRPGLVAFFAYALWKGALLLRCHRDIRVVFGGSVLVTPLVCILARIFRCKALIQAHGLDLLYPSFVYQMFIVWWLRFCDQVVANSGYTASLAKDKGALEESITIIHPGVHWQRFALPMAIDALKLERGLQGKRIILFVGRLARRKGVKEFVDKSLGRIIQELPDVRFLIVGDNPKDSLTHRDDVRSEIEHAISAGRLEEHVQWLGALNDEDLVKVYNLCDVVVLPILQMKDDVEGFGIVALEAAAAAKPVVTTSVGGVPDAVEYGKSGIVVASGDYENMSQSIVNLLARNEIKSSLGEYAQRRVRERFCWSSTITRYEKTLSQILEMNDAKCVAAHAD